MNIFFSFFFAVNNLTMTETSIFFIYFFFKSLFTLTVIVLVDWYRSWLQDADVQRLMKPECDFFRASVGDLWREWVRAHIISLMLAGAIAWTTSLHLTMNQWYVDVLWVLREQVRQAFRQRVFEWKMPIQKCTRRTAEICEIEFWLEEMKNGSQSKSHDLLYSGRGWGSLVLTDSCWARTLI